jgi:filamentous hemagglutinin family protein
MSGVSIHLYWQKSLGIAIGSGIALYTNSVGAQITPDSTLPNNSNVQFNGDTFNITGGTQSGANLFHSFQQFSIPTGSTAYFNNGLSTQNILTRITGKSISNIDGLIGANGKANFFFINPNGIIFGQNARLDIGGSFLASTASSVKFADGAFFSATNPQSTSMLTISVPVGLQYGANPGRIQVLGDGQGRRTRDSPIIDTTNALRVRPDQTLALVGGALSLEGATLKTASGRIELGSVSGEGLVSLTPINKGFSLGYDAVQNFDNIQLFQKAIVDASGTGSGDIQIMGKRITLNDSSQIEASTLGADIGGTMVVNAVESIEAVGSSNSQQDTGFFAVNYPGATGTGGSLTINTRDLLVRGAQIFTGTFGSGKGRDVTINATNSVQFINTLSNSPIYGLSAAALGTATGDGGEAIINTRDLIIRDGGYISARTYGSAKGGNITINATNSVQVIGFSAEGQISSGLFTQSEQSTTGDAGNLTINTGELLVRDRATVAVRSQGRGNAGNLNINARSIRLNNGALLTANTQSTKVDPTKEQATININSQDLIITRDSNITTNAKGENVVGGNININADVLVGFGNSNITANSDDFRGGNVRINTKGIFGIQFRDTLSPNTSDITATGATRQLSGNVQITRPDIDPTNGLIELLINLVDPTQQISTACTPKSRHHGTFVLTGRGGLPMSPNELLQDTNTLSAWVRSRSRVRHATNILKRSAVTASVTHPTTTPIVEATGWIVDSKKDIELVAQASETTGVLKFC